jgi:SAM-dependent methyltransferase
MQKIALNRPFPPLRGKCVSADVVHLFGAGNTNVETLQSHLFLYEDGQMLGPPHAAVAMVEREGMGRYGHWDGVLYFSSSDGTDPNSNGRTYDVLWSTDLYFEDRVQYGLNQAGWVLNNAGLSPHDVKGKRILEIGPGKDAGFPLIMAGLGAHTVGVEKYRSGWDDTWHPHFIDAICRMVPATFPDFDPAPLRACQARNGFDPAWVDFRQMAMEDLPADFDTSFDIACSVAVLEHVCDPDKVFQNIYRSLKPGGYSIHQIDFRDHRDFARPLEFLLLDDESFEGCVGEAEKYSTGNRLRFTPTCSLWQDTGFTDIRTHVNEEASAAYMADFMARLAAAKTKYSGLLDAELKILGASFTMQRPGSP